MSFVTRRISLTFQLAQGTFADGSSNVVEVSGLRCVANISKAGGVSLTSLDLRVYGLPLDLMNQLSTLGKPLTAGRRNIITVKAGDDQVGMAVVFQGVIFQAWTDMAAMPDAAFTIQGHTGLLDSLKPAFPTSIKGSADAAFLLAGIAKQMDLAHFENSGVSVQLVNPYYSGTLVQQAKSIAEAANINLLIESDRMAIWPKSGARNLPVVPISPDAGMVGYPSWTDNGLILKTIFNPNIAFGGTVQVTSSITNANGQWTVFKVDHALESEMPDGKWETQLEATVLGRAAIASG